jgi:hypothetical protein
MNIYNELFGSLLRKPKPAKILAWRAPDARPKLNTRPDGRSQNELAEADKLQREVQQWRRAKGERNV